MQIHELLNKLTPEFVDSVAKKNENMGHVLDMLEYDFSNGRYIEYFEKSWDSCHKNFLEIDVHTWLCSDTVVGIKAIYAKDDDQYDWKLVALTFQPARKSELKIYWRSDYWFNKAKTLWQSYVKDDDSNINLFDYDAEIPEYYLEKHSSMYKTVL